VSRVFDTNLYTCTHSRVKSISTLKIFPYIFHIKPLLFSKHSPEVIPYQKFSPLKAVSEKIFRNQPIRNKNRLWRPCFLKDRYEMSNLDSGLPIDDSCLASVHLAKGFQRRRILKIDHSETRIASGGHVC
jgi:hypothetical protein